MGCRPGSDPSVALGQAMIPGEALHGLHRAAGGCTLREVTFLAKHGANIPICRWNDPVTFRNFVGQESLGESVAWAKRSQKKNINSTGNTTETVMNKCSAVLFQVG